MIETISSPFQLRNKNNNVCGTIHMALGDNKFIAILVNTPIHLKEIIKRLAVISKIKF